MDTTPTNYPPAEVVLTDLIGVARWCEGLHAAKHAELVKMEDLGIYTEEAYMAVFAEVADYYAKYEIAGLAINSFNGVKPSENWRRFQRTPQEALAYLTSEADWLPSIDRIYEHSYGEAGLPLPWEEGNSPYQQEAVRYRTAAELITEICHLHSEVRHEN